MKTQPGVFNVFEYANRKYAIPLRDGLLIALQGDVAGEMPWAIATMMDGIAYVYTIRKTDPGFPMHVSACPVSHEDWIALVDACYEQFAIPENGPEILDTYIECLYVNRGDRWNWQRDPSGQQGDYLLAGTDAQGQELYKLVGLWIFSGSKYSEELRTFAKWCIDRGFTELPTVDAILPYLRMYSCINTFVQEADGAMSEGTDVQDDIRPYIKIETPGAFVVGTNKCHMRQMMVWVHPSGRVQLDAISPDGDIYKAGIGDIPIDAFDCLCIRWCRERKLVVK